MLSGARLRVVSSAVVTLVTASTVMILTAPAKATPADPTVPGSAIASAAVLGAAPIVGGTNLTVTLGGSQVQYQGANTSASSQAVNLGGLGAMLTEFDVCGSALLTQSQLPAPLQGDSSDGASSAHLRPDGVGDENVSVNPSPMSATATTHPVDLALPGLLDIGGTSTTAVSFDAKAGVGRASAGTQVAITLLGGLITINGVSWSATQSLHTARSSQTNFSIGSVSVHLVPGAPPLTFTLANAQSVEGLVKTVNAAIGVLGLSIVLPQSTVDSATGAASVSPMVIHFSGSAIDKAALKPLFDTYFKLEAALFAHVPQTTDCKQIAGMLRSGQGPIDAVLTVIAGVAQGSGALDVMVGGVSASVSMATAFTNPFAGGDGTGPGAGGLPGSTPGSSTSSSWAPSGTTPLQVPSIATGSATAAPVAAGPQPTVERLSSLVRCESTNSGHGCWTGRATLAAVAALLTGAALFLAEIVNERRGTRRTRRRAHL